MERRNIQLAGLGAAIAVAAWLASRAAQRRRRSVERQRPRPLPAPRPLPPADVTPRPPVPPRPLPPVRVPEAVDVTAQLKLAAELADTIASPLRGGVVREIDVLTGELSRAFADLARPGEDLHATAVRTLRDLERGANAAFPRAGLVERAGDAVWDTVFLAAPRDASGHMQLAEWTQTRTTAVLGETGLGGDEILVRIATAFAVLEPGKANPLQPVIELWRRGVVPDIEQQAVVARRDGAVVARAARITRPERGVA